ncbi:MAG: class I SAM-dependent methyltransferase [Balneolaceae bacterium]
MEVFDQNSQEYDQWFDDHPVWFQSELNALDKAVPSNGHGLEIGIGTGRFAEKLPINRGIDPSENMARVAKQRGIETFLAKAENMPFLSDTFDFAVMITTVCFLDDIQKAFRETVRVLKPNGKFIIGMIDKDSPLGQKYQKNKEDNPFYRNAHFHSVSDITESLENTSFGDFEFWQTLITASEEEPEEPQPGYGEGEGGFVVIRAVLQ